MSIDLRTYQRWNARLLVFRTRLRSWWCLLRGFKAGYYFWQRIANNFERELKRNWTKEDNKRL